MAVAIREVFAHTDEKTEVWYFDNATEALTLVVQQGRVAVTLTDTEGVAGVSRVYGPLTVSGIVRPGVSNRDATAGGSGKKGAGVALDGTWTFEDIVVTIAGGVAVPTTTAQGTAVYVTSGGALTLESSGNTKIGTVNYVADHAKVAGTLPIKLIGA